jgi:hypothetical protein
MGKQKFWKKNTAKQMRDQLQPGMRGFLCTYAGNAGRAANDTSSMLERFIEENFPVPPASVDVDDDQPIGDNGGELDIASELKKELAELKSKKGVISEVPNSIKGLLFFRLRRRDIAPEAVICALFQQWKENSCVEGRYISRIWPISHSYKASKESLLDACDKVIVPYLQGAEKAETYCIEFAARNSDALEKSTVLEVVNAKITLGAPTWTIDYKHPSLVIFITTAKKVLMVGFGPQFITNGRYNVHKLLPSSPATEGASVAEAVQ